MVGKYEVHVGGPENKVERHDGFDGAGFNEDEEGGEGGEDGQRRDDERV